LQRAAQALTDETEKQWANEVKKPTMKNFYGSGPATWTREPDIERKYMNSDKVQWEEPELTTLSKKWVVAQKHRVIKLAFRNVNRKPESPLSWTNIKNLLLPCFAL